MTTCVIKIHFIKDNVIISDFKESQLIIIIKQALIWCFAPYRTLQQIFLKGWMAGGRYILSKWMSGWS